MIAKSQRSKEMLIPKQHQKTTFVLNHEAVCAVARVNKDSCEVPPV